MAENNNNGGKNTNIITKINDTISKVLGDFPPVVQTIAKIVVFGGLILLIAKAIGYIFPVIVNVLFNLLVKIVGFCILAAFLYGCWYELTPPTIEIVGFLGGAARFIAKPCLKQRVMWFPIIHYGCSA